MDINFYIRTFEKLWNDSDTVFPLTGELVSVDEKIKREEKLIDFSKSMRKEVDLKKLNGQARKEFIHQFNLNIGIFFKNSFKFSESETVIITNMGFAGVTKKFMTMARNFDSLVNIDDVFQASRNLWIVNSLQIMMGEPVEVTPSIFAYSMLYPYTDNYLDNPLISKDEKLAFSHRFRLRLQGERVIPFNDLEKTIFDLVTMIENDWDRNEFPKVFESLLAIHDAQTKSILLLCDKSALTEKELLSICIEKGGTSVLADGFLVNGKLTPEQEWFCFGFGTYLQFVDDIQDLEEDSTGELETLFTYGAFSGKIEEFVNRTISFSNYVMDDLGCFPVADLFDMKNLMIKSINFLLTEAIGLNDKWFSQEYTKGVEEYSPFRFEFVKKRRSNMESNRISLMKKIENFVFKEDEIAIEA